MQTNGRFCLTQSVVDRMRPHFRAPNPDINHVRDARTSRAQAFAFTNVSGKIFHAI